MADSFATRIVTRKAKAKAQHLVVHIPDEIEPLDRGDRFEDPLEKALRKAGKLGRCTGGGTAFVIEPEFQITGCDVELEVTDLAKALPVIQKTLAAAKAPTGTTVTHTDSETVVLRRTKTGFKVSPLSKKKKPARFVDSCPWKDGEVLAYRLNRTHYCLLHFYRFGGLGPILWVPEWCGETIPSPEEIRQLIRKKPEKYRLGSIYEAWQQHEGERDDSRIVPTGVVIPPPPGNKRGWFPDTCEMQLWKQFDRTLKEFFGLVNISPSRRLNHDLGLIENVPHLAVWQPTSQLTKEDAERLFEAHASGYRRTHPGRQKHPVSEGLKTFVEELKGRFNEKAWVGDFSAREAFVIIPVARKKYLEVRLVAESLADRFGLACYDPTAGRFRCRGS